MPMLRPAGAAQPVCSCGNAAIISPRPSPHSSFTVLSRAGTDPMIDPPTRPGAYSYSITIQVIFHTHPSLCDTMKRISRVIV